MNTTTHPTNTYSDDMELFDAAVRDEPGARKALTSRLEELEPERAETVRQHYFRELQRRKAS